MRALVFWKRSAVVIEKTMWSGLDGEQRRGEDDFWKCMWEMNRLYRYPKSAPLRNPITTPGLWMSPCVKRWHRRTAHTTTTDTPRTTTAPIHPDTPHPYRTPHPMTDGRQRPIITHLYDILNQFLTIHSIYTKYSIWMNNMQHATHTPQNWPHDRDEQMNTFYFWTNYKLFTAIICKRPFDYNW